MNRTKLTMGEVARATGYAKSKISGDRKAGRLSGERSADGNSYEFDASEVARVYGDRFRLDRVENGSEHGAENAPENSAEHGRTSRTGNENGVLEAELKFLRERMTLVETMREGEVRQLQARIEDLRQSLNDAHDQRDRAMTMLNEQIAVTKQLTDQRATDAVIPMPPPDGPRGVSEGQGKRRGLFGLFGRRVG